MKSRSLQPNTKQLLSAWYLDNLSPNGEQQLINALMSELSPTKQKQAEKIQADYYKG